MPIHNTTQRTTLAKVIRMADNPWTRMKGLLGTSSLPSGQALIIKPCQSVHMLFMRYSLDIVFMDDHNAVVGLCPSLKPFALSPVFWKSACAIELPAGTIAETRTKVGDILSIEEK